MAVVASCRLPRGLSVHIVEENVRITGVTAHYVTPDLNQGPIITHRVFTVPDDATGEELREIGQPLEAEALIKTIRLHLNDVAVGRGRTHLSEGSFPTPRSLPSTETDDSTDGQIEHCP